MNTQPATRNDIEEGHPPAEIWGYSFDETDYAGRYASRDAAIEGAKINAERNTFWVGRGIAPEPPELVFDRDNVDEWIETVGDHDDYAIEAAADWFEKFSRDQKNELVALIRPVLAAWLDRHDLRPRFYNVDPATVVQFTMQADETWRAV